MKMVNHMTHLGVSPAMSKSSFLNSFLFLQSVQAILKHNEFNPNNKYVRFVLLDFFMYI